MDPQPPVNKYPTQAPKPAGSKSGKKWLVVGGILILLIVGVILSVVFQAVKSQQPVNNTQPAPKKAGTPAAKLFTITSLDISKKVATFLDKNMLPTGDFNPGYLCSKNSATDSACQPLTATVSGQISPYHGFTAIGYYNLYQKTNDTQYKDSAQKVMSFILAKCSTDVAYCRNSLPSMYYWYKDTGDTKYKDAMVKIADTFLDDRTLNKDLKGRRAYPLWMLYDVTGDTKYKDLLVKITQGLIADQVDKTDTQYPFGPSTSYKESGSEINAYQIIAAGNFYTAAYRATKDPTYLKAAQDFFDRAKVDLHIGDISTIGNRLDMDTISSLEDLAEISDSPKKEAYLNQAQVIVQLALTTSWDAPENPIFNKDYGFITPVDNKPAKIVEQNGLRLLQITKLMDKTFHLP